LNLLVDLDTLFGLLLLHAMLPSWPYAWVSCPHHDVFGKRGGKRESTYLIPGKENFYSNRVDENSRGRRVVLAQKI
jgi:hypothetical protein